MKRKAKALVAFCAFAACSLGVGYTAFVNSEISLPQSFTLTAHTGCEGSADNSLESITLGYEKGADIVEFDLNFDKDGNPVLSHDEPESDCVTLDEAFALVTEYDSLKVNVDVKNTANLKAVVSLAQKHSISERIFYTGITESDVANVKKQTPDVIYYLNMDVDKKKKHDADYVNSLADTVEKHGAVGINFHHSALSREIVEVFRQRGLLVSVWTVNNKLDMYKVLKLSPDNITTRYPSQIKKIIENK